MTDTNEKHLHFLDYLLPILSKSPDGAFIDDIAYDYNKEYGISFDTDEIDHFESLYEYQYFTFPYSDLNRTAKIRPETKEIIKTYGSLSKYLDIIEESKAKEQAKLDNKEQLETEVLKLQKENFEYSQTIRNQEARIRNLEEQNKFIELLKGYWWLLLICIGIGAGLLELWDIVVP